MPRVPVLVKPPLNRVVLHPQDTEFPGVVARPIGQFDGNADYHYQTLRCNCDLLKIIQLGITFTDGEGNPCPECCTWQFNFKFSLSYAPQLCSNL
jgi:CCR4-NOT transcription complex subunit 7/8